MSLRDAIATQIKLKAERAKKNLEVRLASDVEAELRIQAAALEVTPEALVSLIVTHGVYEIKNMLDGKSDDVITKLGLNDNG